ncbi:MAG: 1-deoxy-D-xylulose-5-phosphate reductoisomerase [Lentisphaeria bacterium]|jgi:1-deoxy-D-xylulose-5-phosphate reductoisomerase
MAKNLVILGSTGSIGRAAAWVAHNLGDDVVRVLGLMARSNLDRLAQQARELGCAWAAVPNADSARRDLQPRLPAGCTAIGDEAELLARVTAPEVDVVLCAIVGTAGFKPVLAAIRAGKTIALASKEILVMAGEVVMAEAKRHGACILPVDSEHSAVFQCLEGQRREALRRVLLTASGGPFRRHSRAELAGVTPAQALAHPTWNMGAKVTIDSATLMNKGLEMIEARWLFDLAPEQIAVVVHPQSIVHSLVEFTDGSLLAQLGRPDMRIPIQYALTWPERRPLPLEPLDLVRAGSLTFEAPDPERFPALGLARQALAAGGTLPAVFNAANEAAVSRFLRGDLDFPGISHTVAATMAAHQLVPHPTLAEILAADAWARSLAAGRGG